MVGANPLIVIEWIIAIATIVGGAYMLSPLLQHSIAVNGASPFIRTMASETAINIYAVIYLLTGLLLIAGIVKRKVKWRSFALFFNGLARLFVLLGTLLAQGLLPATWINTAVVMVIVFYIWGRVRKRGIE